MTQLIAKKPTQSRLLLAGAALFASLAVSATTPLFAAEGHEGNVTIYTRTQGVIEKTVSDAGMVDEIIKGAILLDDHAMVVQHGGKMYLVYDHKLANGKMVSDMLGGLRN